MPKSEAANRHVTLEEVLANKEARVQRQREMMQAHPGGIISITVNMPGPVKDSARSRLVLRAAEKAITTASDRDGWSITFHQTLLLPTGPEALISANQNPVSLKKTMIAIEETHPLGRLFDLDVLDEDGSPIPRAAFSAAERSCLVCGKTAKECVRSRAHSREELDEAVAALLDDYEE